MIWTDSEQYWLYAAAEHETNQLLHVWLFSTTTTALIKMSLRELQEKYHVESAVFLADGA